MRSLFISFFEFNSGLVYPLFSFFLCQSIAHLHPCLVHPLVQCIAFRFPYFFFPDSLCQLEEEEEEDEDGLGEQRVMPVKKIRISRRPGDRWMLRGPVEYVPPATVEVFLRRQAIPLDENEGIYVRDIKTGKVSDLCFKFPVYIIVHLECIKFTLIKYLCC